MKYQILYNTYTNSSVLEAFRNRQEFFVVEAHNKKKQKIKHDMNCLKNIILLRGK